jgi:hypothetical protein
LPSRTTRTHFVWCSQEVSHLAVAVRVNVGSFYVAEVFGERVRHVTRAARRLQADLRLEPFAANYVLYQRARWPRAASGSHRGSPFPWSRIHSFRPTFAGGCPPVAEPDAVLLDIVSTCVRATDLALRLKLDAPAQRDGGALDGGRSGAHAFSERRSPPSRRQFF